MACNKYDEMNIEMILEVLNDMILKLDTKIKSGRIKDVKKEELRLKFIRTQGYLCKTYTEILSASKVEELEKEVEQIRSELEKYKKS